MPRGRRAGGRRCYRQRRCWTAPIGGAMHRGSPRSPKVGRITDKAADRSGGQTMSGGTQYLIAPVPAAPYAETTGARSCAYASAAVLPRRAVRLRRRIRGQGPNPRGDCRRLPRCAHRLPWSLRRETRRCWHAASGGSDNTPCGPPRCALPLSARARRPASAFVFGLGAHADHFQTCQVTS